MAKIILALHIDNTKPREEWQQYPFSPEIWEKENARQIASGVIIWEYAGEQDAPAPTQTTKTALRPPALGAPKKCNCKK